MKNFRFLVFLLVLVTGFVSCKKDDPAPPVLPPTKTELLTAKPWKITGITINKPFPVDTNKVSGGYITTQDLYAYNASNPRVCFNDNVRIFKTSNSFSFTQGTNKCDANGSPEYASGTWALTMDEKFIFITFTNLPVGTNPNDINLDWGIPYSGDIIKYTIVELTATSLKYTYNFSTYTFTETLSNQ